MQVSVQQLGVVDEAQYSKSPPPLRGTLPPLRLARSLRISRVQLVVAKARQPRPGSADAEGAEADQPALQLSGHLHGLAAGSFEGCSSCFIAG